LPLEIAFLLKYKEIACQKSNRPDRPQQKIENQLFSRFEAGFSGRQWEEILHIPVLYYTTEWIHERQYSGTGFRLFRSMVVQRSFPRLRRREIPDK
jgi:hypothetical protein